MEYKNCPRCGKVFSFISSPICRKCELEDEKTLDALKMYINDNPGSNIYDVSTATEVSDRKIMRFVREGRLELVNPDGSGVIICEGCGKPIKTGRYCDACIIKMDHEVQELYGGIAKPTEKAKMHTYQHTNKRLKES